jgi:hypothetical protein
MDWSSPDEHEHSLVSDLIRMIAICKLMKPLCSAVNEVEEGAVQSFAIGADGILSADAIANISSSGNGPAHLLALSTGEVSVMNVGVEFPCVAESCSDVL